MPNGFGNGPLLKPETALRNTPENTKPESGLSDEAARSARVTIYSRALLASCEREEIRRHTEECVLEILNAETARVYFTRNELADHLWKSSLNAEEISVLVQGSSGATALIHATNRKDWSDFSDLDLRILESVSTHLGLKLENLRLEDELKSQLQSSIQALAMTIETKCRYTGGHTRRVYAYADAIADYLPFTEEEREKVRLAGLLHDIGKIGVSDHILHKPSELTAVEWIEMRRHTEWGFDIVSRVSGLEDVAQILRFHHERWDGGGYPLGLKGEEIPRASRAITVADAFDAMVTERPYRKAMSPADARIIIRKLSGTQFDPVVVIAFESAYEKLADLASQVVTGT